MSSPIQYLEMGALDDYGYLRAPGWYFWNETWTYPYGPYNSKEETQEELNKYADRL